MAEGIVVYPGGQVTVLKTASSDPLPDRYVRVQTEYSIASVGTELGAIRRFRSLQQGDPGRLGYSAAGHIVEAGCRSGHSVGQAVAVYGAPYVWHCSELVVPTTLVAPIPHGVCLRSSATVGLGAIALHALRSAQVQLGQSVVVMGLGLLGIILSRLAVAAGCFVIAADPMPTRCVLAGDNRITTCQPQHLDEVVMEATCGHGADVVFLMMGVADSTQLEQAVNMSRLRGTVSVVSDAEARLPRAALFQKEVRLLVPQAGGPGRYQEDYEQAAQDYPYSEVRWTEGRNMSAYLSFLARGYIDIAPLLPPPTPVAQAEKAYAALDKGKSAHLTIAFQHDGREHHQG